MKWLVALALVACGSSPKPVATTARIPTPGEKVLALLPDGAQVIVEIDLARLRANPTVGDAAKTVLDSLGADSHVPGLPISVLGSPLASADQIVLAAYGVGTAQAATLTILTTKADVPGGTRITPELVALGSDDWVGQLATRAAIPTQLAVPSEVLVLRDHAMPKGATGAVVRITARLPFDARVALARQTGLSAAPAQLSLWCDLADDLAIVVDAESADPADHSAKQKQQSARELAHNIRGVLTTLADMQVIRSLGIPTSLADAHMVTEGSWVRAIVDVGPRHLARVAERARAMLAP